MRDLHINVGHQYAAHWERLGIKLGLQEHDIANISKDNARISDHSVNCCAIMLEKWLQFVHSPTWGKLDDAIKSLPITPMSLSPKGIVCLTIIAH